MSQPLSPQPPDVLMSFAAQCAHDQVRDGSPAALDLSIASKRRNLRLGNTIRAAIDKAPRGG